MHSESPKHSFNQKRILQQRGRFILETMDEYLKLRQSICIDESPSKFLARIRQQVMQDTEMTPSDKASHYFGYAYLYLANLDQALVHLNYLRHLGNYRVFDALDSIGYYDTERDLLEDRVFRDNDTIVTEINIACSKSLYIIPAIEKVAKDIALHFKLDAEETTPIIVPTEFGEKFGYGRPYTHQEMLNRMEYTFFSTFRRRMCLYPESRDIEKVIMEMDEDMEERITTLMHVRSGLDKIQFPKSNHARLGASTYEFEVAYRRLQNQSQQSVDSNVLAFKPR